VCIMKLRNVFLNLAVVFILGSPHAALATEGGEYFELSLEQLMDIEVTSVSKKKEKIMEAPSAIYVITNQDIKRLGMTSIPELLRVVPGLQVARIDSDQWSISSRGFSGQFANDLLVLIDGRTVYTPIFSGVYWDTQDLILEDVDRIEVIRGPGGTIWGANAVNGVINIITKHSEDTQGEYASAHFGNYEQGALETRYGGKIDEDTSYRLYAKYKNVDNTETASGASAQDERNYGQGGFRVDWKNLGKDDNSSLTVQGDIYTGKVGAAYSFPSLTAPFVTSIIADDSVAGGNMLAKWSSKMTNGSDLSLQAYFDHSRRDEQYGSQIVTTFDTELKHIWQINDRNEIVWGAGYRVQKDDIADFGGAVIFADMNDGYDLWSTFIQDEFKVNQDVSLFIGSKFEVNDFTGFEYQPSVKAVWSIDDKSTFWGAISRAIRTPSRAEDEIDFVATVIPAGTFGAGTPSGFSRVMGNETLDAEKLMAYEIGYRSRPSKSTSVDVAVFYNDYSDLFTIERGLPFLQTATSLPPHMVLPVTFQNGADAKSYGLEFSTKWRVSDVWTLAGNYGYVHIDVDLMPGSTDSNQINAEKSTAKHIFNIHSSAKLSDNVDLDNILFFNDEFLSKAFTTEQAISQYWRFDTRVGGKPTDNVEISLVGQNLLEEGHHEFAAPLYGSLASEIGRSYFLRVTYRN